MDTRFFLRTRNGVVRVYRHVLGSGVVVEGIKGIEEVKEVKEVAVVDW